MADWGRALAGFAQGASNVALQNITARQEEERDERKARLLTRLQVETQKEVAEFERNLALKNADKNFSGAENGRFVYRNSETTVLGDRPLTKEEEYALDKERRDFDYKAEQDRIDNARADAQLADQRARTGILARGQSTGSTDAKESGKVGVGEMAEALIADNKDVIESANGAGMSPEITKRLAYIVSARRAAKGDTDPYSVQSHFLAAVQYMRDRGSSEGTFSLDTYHKNKPKPASSK